MPDFSLHLPRFLRFHRSRSHSPNPSPLCPRDGPSQPQYQNQNQGMFNQAENFSAMGNFIHGNVGNVAYNYGSSNQFMKDLLKETIPGAASDSSARDPPPRCHPGTRLAILEHCLYFISNCDGVKKIRWVVGAAGVGKSAIMQSVVESLDLTASYHASIFFSINGRSDGTKAVITLSYQFAAKSALYRQVIEQEITRDPSLLRSSMAKQFDKLVVQPFIHHPQLASTGRVLVIIDGLDECDNTRTQQELLRLISDLCITYPSSPLVWLIASRPETHITSFFSRQNVISTYEKEQIAVDSDEARADIERFLRDKLTEIKDVSDSLDPQWPDERDFWKLANAAGGLFAYADAVIRYIDDSVVGSPVSQLSEVLHLIDEHPMTDVLREEHPMALLDALYDRILSNVPHKNMVNAKKLLFALASGWDIYLEYPVTDSNFILLCNWLGMTADEAYAAVNHLRSVLNVPPRDEADVEKLEPFHKSFIDYISDFTRSKFSPNTKHEGQQLMTQCALRILEEAPDGIDFGDLDGDFRDGNLACSRGTGDNISLTWLADDETDWSDDETKLNLYKLAIGEVVTGIIGHGNPTFLNERYIRLVTTRLEAFYPHLLYDALRDSVFDESRRPEFMMNGILKQTPLEIVDNFKPHILNEVKLQFRRPATAATDLSDPWSVSCLHEWKGERQEGGGQDWETTFDEDRSADCDCFARFRYHLEEWQTKSPNHAVCILFTSTNNCCVEFRFVDPEDGALEWTYWFWCLIPHEERKKYGSTV